MFLDLDDTLSCVSLYKLDNDNYKEVTIEEKDGKSFKVNYHFKNNYDFLDVFVYKAWS